MNKKIVDMLIRSEDIQYRIVQSEEYSYWLIQGANKKVYLICEEIQGKLDKTLSVIEKLYYNDDVLKRIPPQFIYTIILKRTDNINEEVLREIIAIEENEYFSKKYVLYYADREVLDLERWMNEINEYRLGKLVTREECVDYMNWKEKGEEIKEQKPTDAIKFLLRIIIKCPFVKYEFTKEVFEDFDSKLKKKLSRVYALNKERMYEYKEEFFDKLEDDNIDEMVKRYIDKVIKEVEQDGI